MTLFYKYLLYLVNFSAICHSTILNLGEDIETSQILLEITRENISYYGGVDIYFRSRNTDENGTEVDAPTLESLNNTAFSASKKTIFIIHGLLSDDIAAVQQQVASAHLAAEDVNVFIVDWSKIAALGYEYAQANIKTIGNVVGTFINNLVSNTDLSGRQINLVGHSLGAHIAGIAGAATGGLISSIVGLDPAGPMFSLNTTDNRLKNTDAQFVQVIHTCAGILGMNASLGDADYWPNNGAIQPGCQNDTVTCSHSRAYLYYIESLETGNFNSTRCEDYNEFVMGNCTDGTKSYMGQTNIDLEASGDYFLDTNSESPYAMG